MGVGVNVQEKVTAIMHLDSPQLPMYIEQREGRGLRYGNENPDVAVYRFAMEHTLDGAIFADTIRKSKFIWQVLGGQIKDREFDDPASESIMSFAQQLAAIDGNPLLFEQMDLDRQRKDLELEREAHGDQVARSKHYAQSAEDDAARLEQRTLPEQRQRQTALEALDMRAPNLELGGKEALREAGGRRQGPQGGDQGLGRSGRGPDQGGQTGPQPARPQRCLRGQVQELRLPALQDCRPGGPRDCRGLAGDGREGGRGERQDENQARSPVAPATNTCPSPSPARRSISTRATPRPSAGCGMPPAGWWRRTRAISPPTRPAWPTPARRPRNCGRWPPSRGKARTRSTPSAGGRRKSSKNWWPASRPPRRRRARKRPPAPPEEPPATRRGFLERRGVLGPDAADAAETPEGRPPSHREQAAAAWKARRPPQALAGRPRRGGGRGGRFPASPAASPTPSAPRPGRTSRRSSSTPPSTATIPSPPPWRTPARSPGGSPSTNRSSRRNGTRRIRRRSRRKRQPRPSGRKA